MEKPPPKQLAARENRPGRAFGRFRTGLRSVMPRVAIGAAILFTLRNLLGRTFLFGSNPLGQLLRLVTVLVVGCTIVYYGYKALRWIKRKLFWRVRRRLAVTYLFIGLTPIVLLAILGMLSAFGLSNQGMARIAATQLSETERATLGAVRGLSGEVAQLPATMTDQELQTWLDQRAAAIRQNLPGAQVALWRGPVAKAAGAAVTDSPARWTSIPTDPASVGVGDDRTPVGAPLPQWLAGKAEWSGFSFAQPPSDDDRFGTPFFRAVVTGNAEGRTQVLLISVPVSRALVQRYRENTELTLHPFFSPRGMMVNTQGTSLQIREKESRNAGASVNPSPEEIRADAERRAGQARRSGATNNNLTDQFGERMSKQMYFVVYPATDWANGETEEHMAFFFDWSRALAVRQFLGTSNFGTIWWTMLKIVALVFLIFELFAVAAAVWMTRAVTGTVHKLYRATEFFKRGDFSHRVKVRSRDQLGELATAFNEMSANIEALLEDRVEREKLEREIEIAHDVQARLFPNIVPPLMTVELAAECRAARGVAGDYYDYVEITPGIVALALGDVSGKGMSASLVMANLQASMRSQAAITSERLNMAERAIAAAVNTSGNQALARVIADADIDGAISRQATNINRQLCASTDANRFATLFLSIYEDRTRTLRYTNAGHNPPILVRTDGTTERLTEGGMMVGAFDFATYDEASVQLDGDDVLVIFSDGLSEAEHFETREEYSEDRLLAFAVEHRTMSAHDLRNAIFTEVDRWSGAQERGDDQTLLIVKGEA